MYERFTDRARKVMQLANQEAQRFNHEYIGTEHILLGMVGEGVGGVAGHVLNHCGIDLSKVRAAVDELAVTGADPVAGRGEIETPRVKKSSRIRHRGMQEAPT